jgi:cobalamin biosynthesis protein CbiD
MNARTATVFLALAADAWLHVRVEKTGDDPETVSINVPLDLAAKVLGAVDDEHLRGGKVVLDAEDHPDVDLAAMWKAVREAPDAEFVTVKSRSENVRVAKDKGFLVVLADEQAEGEGKRSTVRVKVPLAVADAMFGPANAKGELDLIAALRELQRSGQGELMTVEDGEETIRIWIDDRNEAP